MTSPSSSQPRPPTPLRVPKAAATYTTTTQDPDLRSQINTVLLRDGHIEKIQTHLSHTLAAHPANWPSHVAAHALSLLRRGECTTFPRLMERVLDDIRRDTEAAAAAAAAAADGHGHGHDVSVTAATATAKTKIKGKEKEKEKGKEREKGKGVLNGVLATSSTSTESTSLAAAPAAAAAPSSNGTTTPTNTTPSLAVPQTVIDEAIRVTRDCLDLVCDMEP